MPYMKYVAIEQILRQSQGSCSMDVVRALMRVQSLFSIGSYVKLSDESIAKVIRANGDHFAEPIVQVAFNELMSPVE